MNAEISFFDYLIIALYIAGVFFLAYFSGRKKVDHTDPKKLIHEQFLAGKSLTFFESTCSIIATEVSALTFLGIPAIAFAKDYSFIQIYFGAIIGRIFIAFLMLPKVYDKGITIYQVMGMNSHKMAPRTIAVFYSLNKFLAVGVRLFAGSIIISEFFSTNIYLAVAIISIITFFYTLIGGLKAVVRTDMIQMGLFILGGIAAHIIIPDIAKTSWHGLIEMASVQGKISFFDLSNPIPFLLGVLGGILFDMSTHGVDQDFAQRLTANRSLKGAQFAILGSSFLSIAVGFLFLSIGSLLWSYYQLYPMPDIASDKIFAHFITHHFPIGLKGLMVAGVLAATMSTLD